MGDGEDVGNGSRMVPDGAIVGEGADFGGGAFAANVQTAAVLSNVC